MLFSNIDFSVVYVDPYIGAAGDGSTPATALKELPEASALADRTCYLIRRTDENTACALPSGTNSGIQHILLMGMPLATDTAYELVPDEAKTAWGGDTETHAVIAADSSSATLNMANLRTFLLHRICLQRTCTSASQYLIQSYQTGEYKGMFAAEHCKFGVRGADIEKTDWAGPAYTDSAMYRYLYLGYVRYLRIKDCTVNYRPGSSYPAIHCQYPDIADIEDTQVNLLAGSSSRSSYALQLYGTSDLQGTEAVVTNLSFRYVFNGTDSRYFAGGLSLYGHLSTRVRGVTASCALPSALELPSDYSQPYQSLLNFSGLQDFSIRDITVNLPQLLRHNGHLLDFSGNGYSSSPGIEREIADVSVTLGTEGTAGGSYSYDEYRSTNSENLYFALQASFGSASSSYYPKPCKVEGVTVSDARGRAASFSFCRLTDCSFQGRIDLYGSVADIASLSTWFPGWAMRMRSNSFARIGTLAVNRENADYPYSYDTAVERDKSNCCCFIEVSNVIPEQISLSDSGVGQQYTVGCASECETGHYTLRTQNIAVDTWNVRRTGGASAALKLWNDKWNGTGMAVLGRKPFKGKLLTAEGPGRYLLKVHVAYKNYTDDNEMGRRLFVTATAGEGDGARTFCSSTGGRWADDSASVWENDTDLVQKCLELPVDVETAGTVDVRLYFSWYSADGFLYVDPSMELAALE